MSMILKSHPNHIHQSLQGARSEISPAILDSWRRSVEVFRLDPFSPAAPRILGSHDLKRRQEKMGSLLPLAQAGIERLYKQLRDAGYIILLSDPEGITVDFLGDPSLEADLTRCGLCVGTEWTESVVGTSAIGMALSQQQPWTVHHGEHFRYPHEGLTCSASPLFDHEGKTVGVLDATALQSPADKRSQHLTLQLVEATARAIEDAHLLDRFRDHYIVRFGSQREFIEIGWDAMLAVDESGRIVGANLRARRVAMLASESNTAQLIGKRFDEYFGTPFNTVLVNAGTGVQQLQIVGANGAADVYLTVRLPARSYKSTPSPSKPSEAPLAAAAATTEQAQALRALGGSDPNMLHNCEQCMRVLDRGIPILLEGETGTGKEVFAQAIHRASKRAAKPFVAINCGAIPESLIESELFGYVAGTFTGASKNGAKGKIALADGGTLFLDEIGDMPLQLQTRLLRVIAEKEVLPLGADRPIPVNINVISATHRQLEALIAEGAFREDLYYRLKGIGLRLTPLRERSDKMTLAQALANRYAQEFGHSQATFSTEAIHLIATYDWPGNIRQLISVLKTGLALSDSGALCEQDLRAQLGMKSGEHVQPFPYPASPQANHEPTLSYGGSRAETLLHALRTSHWNVTRAARLMGISRATAYRWIQRYGITSPNRLDSEDIKP
ncbi:sigma-54-dependent Fis family transcriptional regulator [Pusillimonas noertemannii]|uniref:sigma-54-dependent Fis family transcriptional regulator n=1 Tax=Pusillimonas noertemannii TaxID=305977 RepID=UPI00333E80A5